MLKYVPIAIGAILVSMLGIGRMPQISIIIILGAAYVYVIARKVKDKEMQTKIITLFLAAFLLHIFISIFLYNQTVDTKFYGFSYKGDDYVYGDFGTIVGDLWRRGVFPSLKELSFYNLIGENNPVQYYQLYSAFIFYLFGSSAGQVLLIINCFFYAAIILPVYYLCKSLNMQNKIATLVITFFLFWPSIFYWSLFNLKEPVLLFSLFAILALCMRLQKKALFWDALMLLFFCVVLFLVKKYMAVFFPIMLLYFLILWKWKYKNAVILLSLSILILRQVFGEALFSDLYQRLPNIPLLVYGIRYSSYVTNTPYLWKLYTGTYLATLLYFPLGFVCVLVLPFLIKVFELSYIMSNIESIIWWCLLPFLASGIWIAIKTEFRKACLMLFIFFYWMSLLALTQANMGTLIRQKTIIYCIGFIFIGLGIDRALRKVESRK